MQVIFRGCSFCSLRVFCVSYSACSRVRTAVVQSHITPPLTPSHIQTHTQSQKGSARTWHKYILCIFITHNRKKPKHFYSKPEPFIRSHPFMWTCCCFYTSDLLAPVSHQRIPSNKISRESSHCVSTWMMRRPGNSVDITHRSTETNNMCRHDVCVKTSQRFCIFI